MPPKKTTKSSESAAYRQLKQDLSAGTLGNLYIFYGEEAYLRDYYLDQLKTKLIAPGMESFNYHWMSGKTLSLQELADTMDGLPMMSEHTMVVVEDYDLFKAPEADRAILVDLFRDVPDYCCLVFVYDLIEYKSDARMKKLAGAIKEHGQVVNFTRQTQGDLVDWIHRRFRALDHEIDRADAQYLIFLCGDLMHGLISEIGKIGAYAKERQITRADIDAVAIPQLDAVVFQMTDAITRKQFNRAAEVLGDLLHMQQAPIMILAVLGKQCRQLLTARLALEARQDKSYLMDLWGMRSAYPAERLLESARRFSPQWCRQAVIRCAETDLAMKSVTGTEGKAVLISLLLELAGEGAR